MARLSFRPWAIAALCWSVTTRFFASAISPMLHASFGAARRPLACGRAGCPRAPPPRPGPDRRRSGGDRPDPGAGTEPSRAGDVLGHVVGALLLQVVADPPQAPADHR